MQRGVQDDQQEWQALSSHAWHVAGSACTANWTESNKMAVSNDEIGRRTPNLVTIRKIADALQVTIGKLTVSYGNELVIEHGAFRKHSIISGARI
mgnify:CR=1 FL=1